MFSEVDFIGSEKKAHLYGVPRAQAILMDKPALLEHPEWVFPFSDRSRADLKKFGLLLDGISGPRWAFMETVHSPDGPAPFPFHDKFEEIVQSAKEDKKPITKVSQAFEAAARMAFVANRMNTEPTRESIHEFTLDKKIDELCVSSGLAVYELVHQDELRLHEYTFPYINNFLLTDEDRTNFSTVETISIWQQADYKRHLEAWQSVNKRQQLLMFSQMGVWPLAMTLLYAGGFIDSNPSLLGSVVASSALAYGYKKVLDQTGWMKRFDEIRAIKPPVQRMPMPKPKQLEP